MNDRPELSDDEIGGVAGGTTPGIVGTVGVGAIDDAGEAAWDTTGPGGDGQGADNDHATANGTEQTHASDFESDYGYDATQPA